jgi:hypothetical protein
VIAVFARASPILLLLAVAAAALAPASLIDAIPEGCLLARTGFDIGTFGATSSIEVGSRAHRARDLRCPGCGMTHALWWLLHGDAARALDANPRVVLVAPLLGFAGARFALRARKRNPVGRGDRALP